MNAMPTEPAHCPAHGVNADKKKGLREMLAEFRALQYTGRFLMEVPAWSHVHTGKRQGRSSGGALGSTKPDMFVDGVLERHHNAIFSRVEPEEECPDLLGVEVSGKEHGTRGPTIKADNKKSRAVPFKVLTVKHAPDDDPLHYPAEAYKVLYGWW